MVLIGIDPALVTTGVAIVETGAGRSLRAIATEEIKTGSEEALPLRLQKIYTGIQRAIVSYQPSVLILEKLYSHHRHPQTVSLLGHVRGVVCLLAAEHKLKLVEYAATRVCKALVGKGQASLEQMRLMVHRMISIQEAVSSEHIIDALALAITYAHNLRWEELDLKQYDRKH